jgi:hypothetical protein
MTNRFESFINDTVISENWSIISSRFDVSKFTVYIQRNKIIGEINEFYEARENYKENQSDKNYRHMVEELSDICIACCTFLKLQNEKYEYQELKQSFEIEDWIHLVVNHDINSIITAIKKYANYFYIDLCSAILQKVEYNRTRSDW